MNNGNERASVILRDFRINDLNSSVMPLLIRFEHRGSSTVPNEVMRTSAIWGNFVPAVKKPTASSPAMKPSITVLR